MVSVNECGRETSPSGRMGKLQGWKQEEKGKGREEGDAQGGGKSGHNTVIPPHCQRGTNKTAKRGETKAPRGGTPVFSSVTQDGLDGPNCLGILNRILFLSVF